VETFEEAVWIFNTYLSNAPSLKMIDHRLNDKKKGSGLVEGMVRLYFEWLQPMMETPLYQLQWRQMQERDAAAASDERTNDAPPPDVKLLSPRDRNIAAMKDAAAKLRASVKRG
jgi:hypothetical protein